jgi:GGDEF domain-containing protein
MSTSTISRPLNSSGGDKAGDQYIREAAKRLERRRGVDQVFRLHGAGDEFGILVQGDSARRVADFAEILVSDLSSAGISASIGAACTEVARLQDPCGCLSSCRGSYAAGQENQVLRHIDGARVGLACPLLRRRLILARFFGSGGKARDCRAAS